VTNDLAGWGADLSRTHTPGVQLQPAWDDARAWRVVNQGRRDQPLAAQDQAGQRRQGWPRYAHHARLGV